MSESRTWALSHHQHSQLKNTTEKQGGVFCVGTGVRQEGEHILKLGMLPVSWANLPLPSSGHGEAAYAWSVQAVLLYTSSQY